MKYSEIILKLRQDLNITQNELAELLGVSTISVSRWEQGHFEPTIKIKKKLRMLIKQIEPSK